MSTPPDDRSDAAGGPVPDAPRPVDDPSATGEVLQPTAVLEPLPADAQPTEVIAGGVAPASAAGAGAPPPADDPARAGRRRTRRGWLIAGASVLLVAAGLVVADLVTRSAIEQRITDEAQAALPEGVEGAIDVEVGGFSVLAQLLTGSFSRISVDAPELSIQGNPIDVHVVGQGVPIREGETIDFVEGTVTADADSLNALVEVPGAEGEIVFGDGTVGYRGQVELFGFELRYSVTAEAEAAGSSVILTPVGVELGTGERDLAGGALPDLLQTPLDVCVAKYLPEGVEVDDIVLEPGVSTVSFQASDLPFAREVVQVMGTCD